MTLDDVLEQLKDYRQMHFEFGERMMTADDGNVFPLDILAVTTLNRSLCLLKGFTELIHSQNFIAAAPLIRLQLDNGLRFSAATLVNDPHEFAMNVLKGIPVKDQKDTSNQKMRDFYLVQKLSQRYSWIEDLYKNTSGYVHLSEKHIWNAIQSGNKEHTMYFKITEVDAFVTEEVYIDAVRDFQRSTDVLFEYIYGWINVKNGENVSSST